MTASTSTGRGQGAVDHRDPAHIHPALKRANAGDAGFFSTPSWDDLRVPVTSATVAGSNPPPFSFFINDGSEVIVDEYAYDFADGIHGVIADSTGGLNFSGSSFSVGFWLAPNPDVQNECRIIHKSNWRCELSTSGGAIRGRFEMSGGPTLITDVSLNAGTRNCLLYTIEDTGSGRIITAYVNNQYAGSITDSSAVSDTTMNLGIGAQNNGGGRHFRGTLDELRIWNKVLEEAEISGFYNGGSGTTGPIADGDTVVGYHFNEGDGTSVDNFKGDANHDMTITGGPNWTDGLITSIPGSQGVFTYIFPAGERRELFFTAQMSHGYKIGTGMHPHLHWAPTDDQTGSVRWGLEYTLASPITSFGNSTILTNDDPAEAAYKHQISDLGRIPGQQAVSFMIVGRMFREGDHTNDTYPSGAALLEFDIHYLIDSIGTTHEYLKPT